jgi:hypothetical protein
MKEGSAMQEESFSNEASLKLCTFNDPAVRHLQRLFPLAAPPFAAALSATIGQYI